MSVAHLVNLGPGVSVQDGGRPGYLAQGLSRGGAADALAMAEGAALLGQSPALAALEIAGSFLSLRVDAPTRIALSGAVMQARCAGAALQWIASHLLPAAAQLDLSGSAGGYSYLHLGGGIGVTPELGARGLHMAAGVGPVLSAGQALPLGPDAGKRTGQVLTPCPGSRVGYCG